MLEVVATNSSKFKVGDRVNASSTWQEYTVLKDDAVMPARCAHDLSHISGPETPC